MFEPVPLPRIMRGPLGGLRLKHRREMKIMNKTTIATYRPKITDSL